VTCSWRRTGGTRHAYVSRRKWKVLSTVPPSPPSPQRCSPPPTCPPPWYSVSCPARVPNHTSAQHIAARHCGGCVRVQVGVERFEATTNVGAGRRSGMHVGCDAPSHGCTKVRHEVRNVAASWRCPAMRRGPSACETPCTSGRRAHTSSTSGARYHSVTTSWVYGLTGTVKARPSPRSAIFITRLAASTSRFCGLRSLLRGAPSPVRLLCHQLRTVHVVWWFGSAGPRDRSFLDYLDCS
jgi:hypothetical protein